MHSYSELLLRQFFFNLALFFAPFLFFLFILGIDVLFVNVAS
jgi:hypothetical protein